MSSSFSADIIGLYALMDGVTMGGGGLERVFVLALGLDLPFLTGEKRRKNAISVISVNTYL